jgi:hypothetical protein
MSAASVLYTTTSERPKLLLDANVFRHLAAGSLDHYKDRLLAIARSGKPRLLWFCPITFHEIAGHVHDGGADMFDHIRTAILWMHRLCGDDGVAEDLQWVLNASVFAVPQPYESRGTDAINTMKNFILSARVFGELPKALPPLVKKLHAKHQGIVDMWIGEYRKAFLAPTAPQRGSVKLREARTKLTEMLLDATRPPRKKRSGRVWGALRSEEEQVIAMREVIASETARLMKAGNDPKYDLSGHRNDFNDNYLCAYPAVGYSLVTEDHNIRKALIYGGCKDPRVVDVDQGVEIAEMYLKGRDT